MEDKWLDRIRVGALAMLCLGLAAAIAYGSVANGKVDPALTALLGQAATLLAGRAGSPADRKK